MKTHAQTRLLAGALFIISLLLSSTCNAQEIEPGDGIYKHPRNSISLNPLIMFLPVWNIQYGRYIQPKKAIHLNVSIMDQAIFNDTKMRGFVLTGDYRYYITNERRRSTYVTPYLRYQNIQYAGNGDEIQQRRMSGGLALGKLYYIGDTFFVDLHVGLNYTPTGYKVKRTDGNVDVEIPRTLYGLGPRIGVSVGIGF